MATPPASSVRAKSNERPMSLPDGLVVADELALREQRLARLAEAKAVLEARAKERDAIEQAEYEAKVREREAKAQRTGKPPRGKPQPRRRLVRVTTITTTS